METSMCRCCASEGTFKDFRSSYEWMGEEEIYADMLQECFDVSLSTSELGDGGICEVCITQLRNASNFKKQVLKAEEQFLKHVQNKLFPSNIVKLEASGDEQDSNDDDNTSDWEPEFEVPIKAESPEEVKPKKRGAKSKETATTSSSKKPKTEAHASAVRRVPRTANAKIERDIKPKLELDKHRSNIQLILQCSNATPIRCRGGIGYACSFCGDEYPLPADLKTHTLAFHEEKTKMKFMTGKTMFSYLVKLDVTNLTCKICDKPINSLDEFTNHLIKVHGKHIYTDINSHILPFKFDDSALRCVFCSNEFNMFKKLQEHMNTHMRNYICDVCDAGFVNRGTLLRHTQVHKIGTFKCDECPKVFDTHLKKKSHEKSVHKFANLLSKCGYCFEKFTNHRKKNIHLATVHGVNLNVLKCNACDKTFQHISGLTVHTKRDHLMERRYKCEICEMKFFGANELKLHAVKHSGEKKYKCSECFKSYARKKTLTEHMRFHNNDRRFKCELCGQAFLQKCSWKGHMRNRHGEMV